MSTEDGIQQFLDKVDPVILFRGQDYFHRGHVESINCEDECVTAEVSGSAKYPYLVDIDFNEYGEVEAWDCDCPYSWGPVCKHTVATLLAIQEKGVEQFLPKPAEGAVSLEELVRQADRGQLAALVLEHCREDRRFRSQGLSELEESRTSQRGWVRRLFKSTHQHIGHIDHSAEKANEKGPKS